MSILKLNNKIITLSGNPISIGESNKHVIWHQCPEAVRNYLANVTYDPSDYSTSQIANYAPATPVVANTKPIGKTVGGVTYYNEVPNVETPFSADSAAGTLKPLDALRWLNTVTPNVRDLGGWDCDGGTVKYGMLFRGGEPSASDKTLMVDQIGIKHELQLRGTSEEPQPYSLWGINFSHTTNYVWLSVAESTKPTWKEIFDCVFSTVNKNVPLYFHCAAGADRTGTLAVMLEALLGMSQSDIDKDYELTCFSTGTGTDAQARRRNEDEYKNYITAIKAVPLVGGLTDTFANHAISFAVSLGFTVDEINAYRNACIDGTPTQIMLDLPTYTITNNLTDVTSSNADTSITQYQDYMADLTVAKGYVISDVQIKLNDIDVTDMYFTGTKTTLNCSIQKNLTNCHIVGKNTVIAGQSYVAELIADTGFNMDGATITITMGGIDVSNYYSNGKIAIPNVTGNITITATAVASAPPYTNLANPSDADWVNNARINSSGNVVEADGATVTNYISFASNSVIRIKGLGSLTSAGYNTSFYVENKVKYTTSTLTESGVTGLYSYSYNTITDVGTLEILKSKITSVRFTGVLTGSADDVVITANEEIV